MNFTRTSSLQHSFSLSFPKASSIFNLFLSAWPHLTTSYVFIFIVERIFMTGIEITTLIPHDCGKLNLIFRYRVSAICTAQCSRYCPKLFCQPYYEWISFWTCFFVLFHNYISLYESHQFIPSIFILKKSDYFKLILIGNSILGKIFNIFRYLAVK